MAALTIQRKRAKPETERAFQRRVIALAELHGWDIYHVKNVKGQLASSTSVGFPDLVLARERLLFVELKDDKARPTLRQIRWLYRLESCGNYAALWRPKDWDIVRTILAKPSGHWLWEWPGGSNLHEFSAELDEAIAAMPLR